MRAFVVGSFKKCNLNADMRVEMGCWTSKVFPVEYQTCDLELFFKTTTLMKNNFYKYSGQITK